MAQVKPLSSETCTDSPLARLAVSVPLMVCAVVLVIRSVLELPVSAEKATEAAVVVGATVSITMFLLAPSEPALPGAASASEALRPSTASVMTAPLSAKALMLA